ncbi:hypothetical protein [Nocardia pseudovaccinii]|uniref:hypothetical protein n=1 Tax=Nocardia pseudovaccinii TaxID=189540 RepID=UPI0007A47987|nr:hypothetical protein [Nocardia pseudovaccinii]
MIESLFDDDSDAEDDAFIGQVQALIAPVAANAGAVIDQPGLLEVAKLRISRWSPPAWASQRVEPHVELLHLTGLAKH